MNQTAAKALRDKLMKVPEPKRRHLNWYAALPYSWKMGNTIYAYKDEGYALWLELEFDPQVRAFNLEPEPVVVARGDKQFEIPLQGASVDQAEHLTLHFTHGTLQKTLDGSVGEDLINAQQWESLNASIRVWSDLSERSRLDRINKDALLRYVCAPHVVADPRIETQIVELLKKIRKISVFDIFQNIQDRDEEEIKTALANLVMSKKIFLDMRIRFSVWTEISSGDIFHG